MFPLRERRHAAVDSVRGMTNASSPRLTGIDPASCLGADDVVQADDPAVVALAHELRTNASSLEEFAEAAFVWVRDEVGHSFDVQDRRVTVTAADVLEQRVGLCYAKSHLLAALLRSQGVPTALCYQLLHDENNGGFVLHGLVAVYLRGAWHRQDPRGNKEGVDAQFSLAQERLAWAADTTIGEQDGSTLHAAPARSVIEVLRGADDMLELYESRLPTTLPEATDENGGSASRSR